MSKRKQGDDHLLSVRPKRYNQRFKLINNRVPDASNSCTAEKSDHGSVEEPIQQTKQSSNSEQDAQGETAVLSNNVENECIPEIESIQQSYNSEPEILCEMELSDNEEKDQNLSERLETLLQNIGFTHDPNVMDEDLEDLGDWKEAFFEDFNDAFDYICDEEENESVPSPVSSEVSIYHGHTMPVWVSLLMILLHMVTFSVSSHQLENMLTLISAHCLEVHPGLQSLYHFKKHFATLASPLVKHFYCLSCLTCLEGKDSKVCPNRYCQKTLSSNKSVSYFLEIPIKAQIQNLFTRQGFAADIQHRFNRKRRKTGSIDDIYDGKLYQRLSEKDGGLSNSYPYNISFTLNTDGVPIFKSSKFSIWPVFLMINELPFKQRRQSENVIFAGLWFGESKPLMATYLRPIYQSLKDLEETGVNLTINNENVLCKAYLICTTADLPARSLLMNMNQFNGASGCAKCTQTGETFRTKAGGSVHVYPFNRESPYGPKRTKTNCIGNAMEAVNNTRPVEGIKGPSFLMGLSTYDFVDGVGIDYMHGVLLGTTKLLMKLWISTPFCKEDFSVAHHSDVIDHRLLQIKPPHFITRVPRAVSTHFKYWKASELRSWLFFYSLPILHDLLLESYLIHYAAFVESVHILCGSSISMDSIDRSEKLLTYFVMTFGIFYGDRYCTLNLHQLLHLPECVRQLGPLWATSCFPFESCNGDITKLFHGTQNVELQILSSVNIIQNLPAMISSVPAQFKGIISKLYPGKLTKQVTSFHLQFLGKSYRKVLPENMDEQLLLLLDLVPPNIEFYNRILLRGELYQSKDYERVTKRNSFTVKYFCPSSKLMKYGFIQCFGCHTEPDSSTKGFAFISQVNNQGSIVKTGNTLGITVPHIHVGKTTGMLHVIKIDNLEGICINVTIPNKDVCYICEPANRYETD